MGEVRRGGREAKLRLILVVQATSIDVKASFGPSARMAASWYGYYREVFRKD
jgi:hypothetical protein